MMTFPTIAAGTRANEAIGGYANFVAYCNALAAGVDSVTTTAAGAALKANNLSDLASASTARTNLGLGTMATATATDYLTKAGNLTGLADLPTARTNLGLGTMATEAASDYLSKAGNLSGIADAATARANLGLGTMATEAATAYAALAAANTFAAAQFIDGSANVIQSRVQGHSSQTANLQTWEDHTGSVLGFVSIYGQGRFNFGSFGTSSTYSGVVGINTASAANLGLVIRGVAAQTGNLQEWQNSSGAALASVFSDGSLLTPKIYVGSDGVGNSGSFGNASYEPTIGGSRINTSIQTNTALVVRNSHASASGKLQSWQVTTSNTEVASISAAGVGTFAGITTDGAVEVGRSTAGRYIDVYNGDATNLQRLRLTTSGTNAVIQATRGSGTVPNLIFKIDGAERMNISSDGVIGFGTLAAPVASISAAGLLRWNAAANQQTTVGAAGGASALPATPTKYLKVVDSTGATLVIPAYAAA